MHAIPTRYASTQFRSRLEARFAAFADLVGWRWSYEPYDLLGYIPDFAIATPVDNHSLLIECKPTRDDLRDAERKIRGAKTTAVVWYAELGACDGRSLCAGDHVSHSYVEPVVFAHCAECGGLTISARDVCLRCGDWTLALAPGAPGVVKLWREAGNTVQWHAAGPMAETKLYRGR